MKNSLKNDVGLALLRVLPALMLLTHGIPKLQKLLAGNMEFFDPIGIGPAPSLFLAVIGEVVCPILLIIGYKTRWAALPSAITMAVAAFIVQSAQAFGEKEKTLLYLSFFIIIILVGPGRYSIDKK